MLPELEAKIERSKEQISNLKTEMDSFLETKPSGVVREDDPQTGEWVYRFRSNRDVPLRFSVIVGEILHDLRSSLDQLACHLIRRNSGEKAITSQSGFPVPNVAKDFKSLLGCKVKGARTEVMDIITHVEPYPGGNGEGIWMLHQANIEDKHKLLILVGSAYRSYAHDPLADARAAGVTDAPPMRWVITGVPQLPVENGAELLRRKKSPWPEPEAEDTHEFTFEIAFSQPEILKGDALIPTLTQFTGLTESTLKLFDGWL